MPRFFEIHCCRNAPWDQIRWGSGTMNGQPMESRCEAWKIWIDVGIVMGEIDSWHTYIMSTRGIKILDQQVFLSQSKGRLDWKLHFIDSQDGGSIAKHKSWDRKLHFHDSQDNGSIVKHKLSTTKGKSLTNWVIKTNTTVMMCNMMYIIIIW